MSFKYALMAASTKDTSLLWLFRLEIIAMQKDYLNKRG